MEPVTAKAQGCVCVPPVAQGQRRLGVRKTPTVGGGLHLLRAWAAQLGEGCQQLLGDRSGIVFKVRFAPLRTGVQQPGLRPGAPGLAAVTRHPTQRPCVDEGALPGQRQRCRAADHHGPARPHAGTARKGCAAGCHRTQQRLCLRRGNGQKHRTIALRQPAMLGSVEGPPLSIRNQRLHGGLPLAHRTLTQATRQPCGR